MADATTNTLPIVYAHVTFLSYFLSTQSTEVSNHHHSLETIKNDLSNTQQLLDTYKQQSESLTERLRQEQARHREVTLFILKRTSLMQPCTISYTIFLIMFYTVVVIICFVV